MRPKVLYDLFAEVTTLPGVGPKVAKLVEQLAGPHVVDLVWHLPSLVVDRRYAPGIAAAEAGRVATLTVRVLQHEVPHNRRAPYRVRCADDSGILTLVFFHAREDYLRRMLPEGQTRVVSGRLERYGGDLQMPHPDHIVPESEKAAISRVEPVYPLTAGLAPKTMQKAVQEAVRRAPALPEWLDPAMLGQRHWPAWQAAVRATHAPADQADLSPENPARERLAYDELLANQLALGLVRMRMRKLPGQSITGDGSLREKALAALPFALTNSQQQALGEIGADMAGPTRMLRLLQGDVGSGKTVVALMAMLIAVESGRQAVLMAPTEILARQHARTIESLAAAAGVRTVLLTGREKGKTRAEILAALESGAAPIAIGTHALFQDDVAYRDLALAVIDEQHRFGVHQRLTLAGKGKAVDVLVMTATPIPRTLLLTSYGDMEVSRLLEKPGRRTPIDTRTVPLERLDEVVSGIRRAIGEGARCYWVCPLVEESETSDTSAAEQRFATLAQVFGDRVGLVHGRMKGPAKDAAMAAFAEGRTDILVATTVIEVGVDVPEATAMVIEHAERFGLAQLHQLRGRVGRGDRPSTCLLLYAAPLTETARARLSIMRETDDGFRIAEEDLRLRGAGEVLGTRQSGLPTFRLADLAVHGDLLETARREARFLLETDPELAGPRSEALRVLLYLFERDSAARLLRSG
ncbi:MAG: ATP-dependent DNA helicase RecG [Acetobacterales bacterium]